MKLVSVLLFVSGILWLGAIVSASEGSMGGGVMLGVLHISIPIMAYTYAKHLSRPAFLYGFVGFLIPPVSAFILPLLSNLSPKRFSGQCFRCGKSLTEISEGGYVGAEIASALLDTTYSCKSCGTNFCLDCMSKLKQGNRICPYCKQDVGW